MNMCFFSAFAFEYYHAYHNGKFGAIRAFKKVVACFDDNAARAFGTAMRDVIRAYRV